MPPSEASKEPTEGTRVQVLLERVEGQLKAVSEGYAQLDLKIEQAVGRLRQEMHQEFSLVKQAINELQAAVKDLDQEVRRIGGWVTAHERVHSV